MSTVRWGIVTAGAISHDFCNAFNSFKNKGKEIVLAAVAARDPKKAAEFAQTHNIPKVFDSYEAMAKSNDIDVAYIGSLNPEHYELAKLFLNNNKHVLCEKPLCMNFKQTKSLIDLAKKKRLFLMEAIWSRCSPAYKYLEQRIRLGKIGDVKYVEANFGIPAAPEGKLRKRAIGGSALMDFGLYTLQFAQFIFQDEPIKVSVVGDLDEDGKDVVETVVLDYEGGRRAVLNIHANLKLWNSATIIGTEGKALLEDPFHFPTEVIINGESTKFPLHESKLPYNFGNSAGLVYEVLEVSKCLSLRLIESARMRHHESLILSKIEDSIRKQLGVKFEEDDKEYA